MQRTPQARDPEAPAHRRDHQTCRTCGADLPQPACQGKPFRRTDYFGDLLKAGTRFHWETRGGESRELTVLSITQATAAAPAGAGNVP